MRDSGDFDIHAIIPPVDVPIPRVRSVARVVSFRTPLLADLLQDAADDGRDGLHRLEIASLIHTAHLARRILFVVFSI
jgi:hypothetical protein